MSHAGYVLTAWFLTFGIGALYALRVVVRGRALAGRVPLERRRWISAGPDTEDQSS